MKVNLPEPDRIALASYWSIKSILYKIHADIIFKSLRADHVSLVHMAMAFTEVDHVLISVM